MNTELVAAALWAHGRRLVVLDCGEVTDDVVRDVVEVLTWLCARRYGRGSAAEPGDQGRRVRPAQSGPNLSVPGARMSAMSTPLRRMGDPVVAAGPVGVRIRTRIHPGAEHAAALTAVSSSRWAGAITRAVEDQYQLGMRGLAAHVRDLGAAVEVLAARCALCPGERALVDDDGSGRCGRVPGGAARSAGHRAAGVGGRAAVDHRRRETLVAPPQPPR